MDTVVLAYSGGLDTSVAIKWIKEKYNLDVIALTIDLGSERNLPEIRQRALDVGAVDAKVVDGRDLFHSQTRFGRNLRREIAGHDEAQEVCRGEEIGDRHRAGERAEETVRVRLIAAQRVQQT